MDTFLETLFFFFCNTETDRVRSKWMNSSVVSWIDPSFPPFVLFMTVISNEWTNVTNITKTNGNVTISDWLYKK